MPTSIVLLMLAHSRLVMLIMSLQLTTGYGGILVVKCNIGMSALE